MSTHLERYNGLSDADILLEVRWFLVNHVDEDALPDDVLNAMSDDLQRIATNIREDYEWHEEVGYY